MTNSEKLCLKWNHFQENISKTFVTIREENDFADVTLTCKDGQPIDAHKLIMSASSSFFKNILIRNSHPHPLIYMTGLKSEDLLAIVKFLYYGTANIYQENLEHFLNIADELQIKGLQRAINANAGVIVVNEASTENGKSKQELKNDKIDLLPKTSGEISTHIDEFVFETKEAITDQ